MLLGPSGFKGNGKNVVFLCNVNAKSAPVKLRLNYIRYEYVGEILKWVLFYY